MTEDRRLRIGGWAALVAAIIAPVEVVAVVLLTDGSPAVTPRMVALIEIARIGALLVAVIGLHGLFRSMAPSIAAPIRLLGALAAVIGIGVDLALLATVEPGSIADVLALAVSVLIGVWFIGGGAILMREGNGLARIGWTAELGGVGIILSALAITVRLTGPGAAGMTWTNWFQVLGLFVVVYLVRLWRYVVGGRMPGPGIL